MNPRDMMTDAIHNFHPQYQQYTQYSSGGQADNSLRPGTDVLILKIFSPKNLIGVFCSNYSQFLQKNHHNIGF
jgi:hypothetical protein